MQCDHVFDHFKKWCRLSVPVLDISWLKLAQIFLATGPYLMYNFEHLVFVENKFVHPLFHGGSKSTINLSLIGCHRPVKSVRGKPRRFLRRQVDSCFQQACRPPGKNQNHRLYDLPTIPCILSNTICCILQRETIGLYTNRLAGKVVHVSSSEKFPSM